LFFGRGAGKWIYLVEYYYLLTLKTNNMGTLTSGLVKLAVSTASATLWTTKKVAPMGASLVRGTIKLAKKEQAEGLKTLVSQQERLNTNYNDCKVVLKEQADSMSACWDMSYQEMMQALEEPAK